MTTQFPGRSWPRLLALLVLAAGWQSFLPAQAQLGIPGAAGIGRDSVPSLAYFGAIEQLYKGDYRNAERTLRREVNGSIKIGVTSRWLDAIAYHAMLGEVYYQQGRFVEALQQFDQACLMFLQYPNWMIRVSFQREPAPDINRSRQALPWGQSKRNVTLGRFPSQEKIQIGDSFSEQQRVAQQGGVLRGAQFWTLDAIEIVRATAHAIRRRNELLGPLGPEDTISRELVTALSRGNTIPNHWSKAWADLLLGLAQAGVGKPDQADKYLQRALLIRGQYDHPLTCVALLELGKWKMVAGDVAAAVDLFAEASYSAFYYYKPHTGNLGVIDEAFRLGTMCRLASGVNGLNPALDPAAAWASRKRFDHLTARLNFAAAEESIQLGNVKAAQATLATGQSRLQDAATGLLGNWSRYLDARLQFLIGRETATAALSQAIQQHVGMSRHNLRLQLANQRYDQQQLRARSAVSIYQMLLGDPRPVDWVFRPFETLATMQTPHGLAYNRWMDAVLTRKNMATALEISDLAKRHRYHRSLAWGGRLAALRDTLETPEHLLSQKVRNQRHELLLRYPQYDEAIKRGQELQAELSRRWQPGIDAEEQSDLIKLWRQWDNNLAEREGMINQLGLQRAAVDIQYPPVMPTTTLQKQLEPGQAVVVFHETPAGMIGFLLTSKASTSWQCAPKKRLNSLVSQFLRDLGNNDANHQLPTETLLASDWLESGSALYAGLFQGSSLDPSQLEELIVVPDGVVWYVPFAALPVQTNERLLPLISASRIRMAPTVGLAVGHTQPWRRVQRTGFVGHQVLPGADDDDKTASLSGLREVADNPVSLPEPSPVPTPTISALTDTLVVLDDIELELSQPLGWSPVSVSRKGKQSSLSHWLTLPQFGPQRILLPAARTVAERGGKISRRKSAGAPAGTELFLASCGLMSTGAQTILLSSWRVGGDATLELTREFLQELPYTSAADAWQRSVQLAMELPLDPDRQPRVKMKKKDDVELTAAHPFFWSGYLLIDSGAPPAADDGPEPPEAQSPPVAAK